MPYQSIILFNQIHLCVYIYYYYEVKFLQTPFIRKVRHGSSEVYIWFGAGVSLLICTEGKSYCSCAREREMKSASVYS